MLKEKQEVYTKIFIAQTERLMSQENAVCVAGDTPPSGEIDDGTKWLDTSGSNMIILKEYNKGLNDWKIVEIASTEQPEGDDWDDDIKWLDTDGASGSDEVVIYRYNKATHSWVLSNNDASDTVKSSDYTVYLENFAKLTAIEQVLAEKEKLYEFYSNGVAIQGRYITSPTKQLLKDAAKQYFGTQPIDYPSSLDSYDEALTIYTFTITGDENKYAVKFTASSKLHSFDLHAFAGKGMCRAVVTLYSWSEDYETTVSSTPFDIYTLGPLSKKDIGAVQAMMFPSIKTPPAGEYLIVISCSSPDALLLMGEKTEAAEQSGIVCYKNGVEYDKTPCMTMAYHQS